jgi:rRNA processing protein Krr1/Pno1
MSAPVVSLGLGAAAGVVGALIGSSIVGDKFMVPIGVISAIVGYAVGGIVAPASKKAGSTSAVAEWEDEDAAKKQKKQKKAAAEARKREAAAAAKQAEADEKAAKKAAEKKAEKTKAKKATAAPVAVVESESEAEEEVAAAPLSKTAIKKAKAKAKELAAKKEAEAAAKAAAKKEKKKGGAAAAAAAPVAAAAAPAPKVMSAAAAEKAAAKAAAAAFAADLEGWETIEATKPTKSQVAKAAATAVSPAASGKKVTPTPSSERLLTEDLVIAIKQHALIIGPGGATLNMLVAGSGATIDMPKRDSGSSKIQITGTPAQVAAAKNAIQSLADRGFSSITHPGTLSDDITVEATHIGLILGANGATLRAIQTKTETRINLPEKGSASKKVTIVGEKEGVKAAKAALRSLIVDGFSTLTHDGWVKLEVNFPAEKFGILIGPKGQTIKSIQGNTKTRINMPEKNSKATTVSVCGLPAGVAQAEKEINRLLEPLAPLPAPEEEDLATDDAWGQEHTAQGEDALWE